MPLQHISDHILKSMNRGISAAGTKALIDKIRARMPNASVRTTFIVGMPGETSENFNEMLQYVQAARFEKMGVFVYSREEGTPAYDMPDQVPQAIKRQRMNTLMGEQKKISHDIQQRFVGRRLKVLIEEKQKDEENMYLGRREYDAPDVDGLIYVRSQKELGPGDFVKVLVTDAYEYDLAGEIDESA